VSLALEDPGKANAALEGRGTTGKIVLSLVKERLNAKEVGLMAGQMIEFANGQGYTDNLVVCNKPSRFATVSELSASIVHQLKQPLTSMLANAQAAKRWLAAEPPNLMEAIASIDRIARDTRAASETMDQIWALYKQAPLDKKEASVPAMMSEALRVVLEDPNKREVQIEWHFEENLPKVCVNPRAIEELFINLTSNAMEAMENTKSPLVEVRAAVTDQNEMLVQVIDNGPGIGDTEEIFDAFLTTKENGLGIGLAVSRSIAKAHGGRLWAENNPSGGAIFCLALPLRSRNQIPTVARKSRKGLKCPTASRDLPQAGSSLLTSGQSAHRALQVDQCSRQVAEKPAPAL
jgi:signal transduction histidine kinase